METAARVHTQGTLSTLVTAIHEKASDGHVSRSCISKDASVLSPTVPPAPTSLSASLLSLTPTPLRSKRKVQVAIMKYQFGNYDYKGVDDKWYIPEFDNYEVQGFFFASKGLLRDEDALAMEAYGWKAVVVDLEPGTPYVASERVTTKKHKFCVPAELRTYDFVITHDCDVGANYGVAIPYMLGLMDARGNTALFQLHERGLSTLEEIDLFLREKSHRILTSRNKVIEWRTDVEELVRSQRYDLSGSTYIKANCFAFRPNEPSFLRAGQLIFEKCLLIQRDQFIIPWAVQAARVNYSFVTQNELEAHGFDFPVALRDARTGVFN